MNSPALVRAPQLSPELQKKENIAKFLWTGVIITFFVIQAILWAVAITLTHNDPSNGVVEDYDQKALNWNAERQMRDHSRALGWTWQAQVGPAANYGASREIRIELRDREGQLLSGQKLHLVAFHGARSAEAQHLELLETSDPGIYQGNVQVSKLGRWLLEIKIESPDNLFVDKQEIRIQ